MCRHHDNHDTNTSKHRPANKLIQGNHADDDLEWRRPDLLGKLGQILQTLGINGAPDVVPSSSSLVSANWTVCDVSTIDGAKAPNSAPDVSTVTILGHRSVAPRLSGSPAALVQVPGTSQTFVLFNGHRSLVGPGDSAVALALDQVNCTHFETLRLAFLRA